MRKQIKNVVLFSWSPRRMEVGDFHWDRFTNAAKYLKQVKSSHGVRDHWHIGHRIGVQTGAVAMLVRTGTDNHGVVLSGVVRNGAPSTSDKMVEICWDRGILWDEIPSLGLPDVFGAPEGIRLRQCLQQSGHTLEGKDAEKLLAAWDRHLRYYTETSVFPLGARQHPAPLDAHELRGIQRNATKREQSTEVRTRLLKERAVCAACGLKPLRQVGPDTGCVLDVHHLELISYGSRLKSLDNTCLLCRNCHAIAHLRTPPMTIAGINRRITRQ
jgi:hypothetical protein